MMNERQQKICELLGNGLAPVIVAQTVGCDPSYVSQLLSDDEFALEVSKRRCATIEQDVNRDNKYDSLEDKLLEKLENVLPFMLKPRDILDALTRINSAKRRATVGRGDNLEGKTTIINLVLPQVAIHKFQLSTDGEVIQVGERPLVNMPASVLMKSLENGGPNASKEQAKLTGPRIKNGTGSVLTEDSV